jgi:hypothetical protein
MPHYFSQQVEKPVLCIRQYPFNILRALLFSAKQLSIHGNDNRTCFLTAGHIRKCLRYLFE